MVNVFTLTPAGAAHSDQRTWHTGLRSRTNPANAVPHRDTAASWSARSTSPKCRPAIATVADTVPARRSWTTPMSPIPGIP